MGDVSAVDGSEPNGTAPIIELAADNGAGPLVRIRSLLPGLARAEQRVAKVVLDDPSAVANRSITEVALAANTSETTVTRFCKAVGVGGYPQLRIALAADTARSQARGSKVLDSDIGADDDLETIVSKISFAEARAVEDTASQLNIAVLANAVTAVSVAPRIDIYGVGASAFVASDLQQKLHRISKVAFAWSDTHVMLNSASLLGERDVALGISYSGSTSDTIEALRAAKQRGATTIAITNFARSPITTAADYTLTTAAHETTFRAGWTASRITALTVTDCLFVGVAQRMGPTARTAVDPERDATMSHRLGVRPDGRRKPHEWRS